MGSGTSVSAGGISEITDAIDVRGNVDGISSENECFFFAFQIIISEYERLKSLQEKGAKSALDDFDGINNNDKEDKDAEVDSLTKFDRLEVLYMTALLEWKLPLQECSNPVVMIYKYSHLSTVEKTEYHALIVKKITDRSKGNIKKEARDDSKSFGGTAEDSRAEKEAALLLRGAYICSNIFTYVIIYVYI
jgi:hypothetical protein